jgi:hypothetical protein
MISTLALAALALVGPIDFHEGDNGFCKPALATDSCKSRREESMFGFYGLFLTYPSRRVGEGVLASDSYFTLAGCELLSELDSVVSKMGKPECEKESVGFHQEQIKSLYYHGIKFYCLRFNNEKPYKVRSIYTCREKVMATANIQCEMLLDDVKALLSDVKLTCERACKKPSGIFTIRPQTYGPNLELIILDGVVSVIILTNGE